MAKKKKEKSDKISLKDMCDKIVEAEILVKADGTAHTAEEIYNYSPTGELAAIFEWYTIALAVLKK